MATYKVRIRGTALYLQHRYPMPDEEEKFAEECKAKGFDPKKTSNIEASWYRNANGAYIPSEQVKGAITGAGKGEKVEGRGNATWNNILKVAAAVLPGEIPFDPPRKSYDEVHKAYAKVGMARILRERPCFHTGWEAEFSLEADSSEIDEAHLKRFITKAGRRVIGDYRPEKGGSFGTFEVVNFERLEA
jgi:hypothetical protein